MEVTESPSQLMRTIDDGRPVWHTYAACRGMGTALFFPPIDVGNTTAIASYKSARVICSGCVVRPLCLAVGAVEREGLWGGLSPRERMRVRRKAS